MDSIEVSPLVTERDMVITEDKLIEDISIFKPSSTEFADKGLYSLTIFGPIGSKERNKNFGFIKLKTPMIVPDTLRLLGSYDKNFIKLMNGEIKAKFDVRKGEFIYTEDGDTGYSFFTKHLPYLKFKYSDDDTITRKDTTIKLKKLLTKENNYCMLNYVPVIPAGLRDYTVGKDGRGQDHEVNDLYRQVLIANKSFGEGKITPLKYHLYDQNRVHLQVSLIPLYEYFMKILEGKEGFIQSRFTKRGVLYGSRNVITSMPSIDNDKLDLDVNKGINNNTTFIGLFQFFKTVSPLAKHELIKNISSKFLDPHSGKGRVIDPKSKKLVYKELSDKEIRYWTTSEGIDSLINRFLDVELLKEEAMIDGYHIAYVVDDGSSLMVTQDTSIKGGRPITYLELLYFGIMSIRDNIPSTLTRFPVTGGGSIYPTYLYVITTVPYNKRYLKSSEFLEFNIDEKFPVPKLDASIFNAVSPHYSKIPGLGGDFDGDQVTTNAILTEDAQNEVKELLNDISFYINIQGKLKDTNITSVLTFLERHYTKPYKTVIIVSDDKKSIIKKFPNVLVVTPKEFNSNMKADVIYNLTNEKIPNSIKTNLKDIKEL